MTKRIFDFTLAFVGLCGLGPVFVLLGFFVKLDSPGPVLFRQERIGRNFQPFILYKFRTMVLEIPKSHMPLTIGEDPRITRVGRILRKTKLDELPQLFNVLRGDMSLVGPRPEMQQYVEIFQDDYQEILKVRPGITDLASLKFCDESETLSLFQNPEEAYIQRILPEKIQLAKEYIRQSSLLVDFKIIMATFFKLAGWRTS